MTYAIVYAENADIIGVYRSRDDAVRRLAAFLQQHPDVQDEVGLRPYKDGHPAGAFEAATEVLADALAQPHLT